ncbi:phosphate ABC transporter permease subunit PstC [Ruficoccus amylovorans]|uniref:Phosphate transport system permease protein n=1 Tax=Ruficoccus amylovorans TaxID=1804625 RepID=A0A842HFD8_9BACT|nr:phosphate ABC transporter permease subunit PstC [Ruficoccus amylovorans]MBC2594287.1 phosphate ABC transporter permease subunit PstC [Ruficoccus amylovorans]
MNGSPTQPLLNLRRRRGRTLPGPGRQTLLKAFFGGNALVAVIVLLLITFFLFREGLSFFPQYRQDMELYRRSGMEYASLVRAEHERFNNLLGQLVNIRREQILQLEAEGKSREEIAALTAPMQAYITEFGELAVPLRDYQLAVRDLAAETYKQAQGRAITGRPAPGQSGLIDYAGTIATIKATFPQFTALNDQLESDMLHVLKTFPELEEPQLKPLAETFRRDAIAFTAGLPRYGAQLAEWEPERGVGLGEAVRSFLFGDQWLINNNGHSLFGLLPLLTGSLLVTGIAVLIAIPFGVGAAIYTNQMARRGESGFIKPCIEFITAIPSVVIGFFGIAVFGTLVRTLSQTPWLEWLPGFPVAERLNAFTAGCLLALMAIPTIFTLSEDAISRVPRIYAESSLALGATRFQTTMRIIVPTAVSGIVSAVLLGVGRVIGETMVVLLCAGNRIRIPDFTEGPGAAFQPVHTLTGIIAQEMGEVAQGGIHYRALFCVGVVLFLLTLGINFAAQRIFRHSRVGE